MNKRKQIADRIFGAFSSDENNAIELWKTYASEIHLDQNDLPTIDVLTVVYNAEQYIANSIDSIVLQSYPNIHLIIVTDPCTDKTVEIIKEYTKEYTNITLVENTEHKGMIECFNIGLSYCTHDYIARMDLDDLIHPMRFEMQMDFLKAHPEISAVSANMKIFNEKHETRDVIYREDFDLQKISLLFFSPISHAASLFRSKVLKELGYRNDYKYAEDYDLWSRLMENHKTAVYPEILYLYRTHSGQTTSESNKSRILEVLKKVNANILSKLAVCLTDNEKDFYVNKVMLSGILDTKEDFILFDSIFSKIYYSNLKVLFFNSQKLKEFVFYNYWQNGLYNFYNQLSMNQLSLLLKSPYNNLKFKEIIKIRFKKILGL